MDPQVCPKCKHMTTRLVPEHAPSNGEDYCKDCDLSIPLGDNRPDITRELAKKYG